MRGLRDRNRRTASHRLDPAQRFRPGVAGKRGARDQSISLGEDVAENRRPGAEGSGARSEEPCGAGRTATKHWGRIFYKVQVPEPKPTSGVIHNTWVTLLSAEGTNHVVDTVEATSGMHQWAYNRTDSCAVGSPYDWKYDDAWHCVEWYVDGPASAYRFFSDSTEVTSIDFTGRPVRRWQMDTRR